MCTFFHYNLYQAAAQRLQRSCPGTSWNMPLSQGTHDNEAPETWLVPSEGQRQTVGMYGRSYIWFILLHDVLCKARMPTITRIMTLLEEGIQSLTFVCHFFWVGEHPNLCHVVSHPIKCLVEWYMLNIASFVYQRVSSWQRPFVCTDPSSTRKKLCKGKVLSENHSCCPTRIGLSPAFFIRLICCVCASLQKLRKAPVSNNAAKRTFPDSVTKGGSGREPKTTSEEIRSIQFIQFFIAKTWT